MNDRIVDACAKQLVMNPWQFDVIVTTNLFGDILSDQLAGLVGGLGMAPVLQSSKPFTVPRPISRQGACQSARTPPGRESHA